MKFLDLNTGYTFDGLWHNWMPWLDWEVKNFKPSEDIDYTNTESTEYLFSYNYDDDDPVTNPSNWTSEFDKESIRRYAIRFREPQIKGYIFWFPNEQSTSIVYTMPICIITDNDTPVHIKVEQNDVFSIITPGNNTVSIDGYTFDTPNYLKDIYTEPQQLNDTTWAHVFNVSCCAHNAGEYLCKISINDDTYIRVGADLYGEYEPYTINLSNMGVELPDMIQKSIYEVNVHEDAKNSIVINRKLKELLSNYWDIVANKGSYKSLVNSLKWFEWGDKLTIKEIWKHNVAGKTIFDDRSFMTMFEDKVNTSFTNFVKTTYISIYCHLQNELSTYDSEKNPNIEQAVFKWAQEDIRLKLSLLAQHFSIYFMPVHMSILYAAAENIVFTNTIKTIYASGIKRHDSFGDFNYVECNIKDNTVFNMTNVSVQATTSTPFASIYPISSTPYNFNELGVDEFPSEGIVNANNINTFAANYYTGPGVIIPVKMTIPNQSHNDFVKYTVVDYNNGLLNENNKFYFYDIFRADNNGNINVNLNLVAKFAGNYAILFTFVLASGKTITRKITFTVEDTENLNINIYKIQAKADNIGFTYDDFKKDSCSKYLIRTQGYGYNPSNKPYTQYLPYMTPNHPDYGKYNGIKLNRTIVIDLKNDTSHEYSDEEIAVIDGIMDDYLKFTKCDENDSLTYLIYVSKHFYADMPEGIAQYNIIRNDLGFYPQFHELTRMHGDSIDAYTISQYDAICCAAEINDGKTIKDFKYGHILNNVEWEFTNVTFNETIQHPASSVQPFIANDTNKPLRKGTYGIKFNYSLTNGFTKTCELTRAFKVK